MCQQNAVYKPYLDPNLNRLKMDIFETLRENGTQIIWYEGIIFVGYDIGTVVVLKNKVLIC